MLVYCLLEMTYEMLADIDEDTALLRIFDTANTVMYASLFIVSNY